MSDSDSTHNIRGAERRREKRYEVKLAGQLGVDGKVVDVTIGDLSASGALLLMSNPPEVGEVADLWIVGFGDLEIQVMFSGETMCGVVFTHPAACRDRLLHWLKEEVDKPERRTP
jgi:hypothetical protein